MKRNLLWLCGFLVACGAGGKGETNQDLTYFASLHQNPAAFKDKMLVLGELKAGEQSAPVDYSNPPPYRAFTFAAKADTRVAISVHSDDADAIAWLLDSEFQTLAKNDDAKPGVSDSLIVADLKATGTYYIAFRDLDLEKGTFIVGWAAVPVTTPASECNVDSDCGEKLGAKEMVCREHKCVMPYVMTKCSTDDDCNKDSKDDLHPMICQNSMCVPKVMPKPCEPKECGPAPAFVERVCQDGKTTAGPRECVRNEKDICQWIISTCPEDMK